MVGSVGLKFTGILEDEEEGRTAKEEGSGGYEMDALCKRDNLTILTIGTDSNILLASYQGKEIHHPIIGMLWGYVGQ